MKERKEKEREVYFDAEYMKELKRRGKKSPDGILSTLKEDLRNGKRVEVDGKDTEDGTARLKMPWIDKERFYPRVEIKGDCIVKVRPIIHSNNTMEVIGRVRIIKGVPLVKELITDDWRDETVKEKEGKV